MYLKLVNTLDSSLMLVLVPGSLLLGLTQPLLQLTQFPVPLRVCCHILPSVLLNLLLQQRIIVCLSALFPHECQDALHSSQSSSARGNDISSARPGKDTDMTYQNMLMSMLVTILTHYSRKC